MTKETVKIMYMLIAAIEQLATTGDRELVWKLLDDARWALEDVTPREES